MGDESNPMKPASPEQAVFAEALLRPTPEARVAYLDVACGLDTPLRRRVEALLRAADNAGDFLEEPPTGLSNVGGTTLVVNVPSEKPGDKIGRYKLLQQIGEGGCGVVYMAEQEEPVRRRVALKVIKLGMDTKSVIARFEAERQALALMDHPNIAKVLDGGATQTGRPYFVMELVRGIKITDYCDQNNLPTEERLKLFTQVCQAIQHAHQKGIIHRDIKPSNILVTISDPGSPGCPKVIDFGIAKATTGQRLTDMTVFTAFEQFIGTPAYMSPEQAMMTSLDIDTRTDIYALGVLLYELLTGRTPFDARELMAGGLDAMRRIILEQEPARPSTRLSTLLAADLTAVASHRHSEPARLGTLLRGDLDWIVMKALEKDRTRRYETANGLAADIQRHLDNEPVVARPPSTGYRFQKMVRRNKLAFAAASAVTTALVLGMVVSTWQAIRATRAEHLTESARVAEVAQRKLAETARTAEADQRKAAEASQSNAEKHRGLAEANFQKARATVDEYFTTISETTLLEAPGLQPLRKRLLESALSYYQDFLEQARDNPELQADLAAAHLRLSVIYVSLDRSDDAAAAMLRGLELVEPLIQKRPGDAALPRRLAGFFRVSGDFYDKTRLPADPLKVINTLQRAAGIWEQFTRDNPTVLEFQGDLAGIYLLLGVMFQQGNDYDRSLAHALQSRAILEKLVRARPATAAYQDLLISGYDISTDGLKRKHQPQEGERLRRQAVSYFENLAREFPAELNVRRSQARVCLQLGNALKNTQRAEAEVIYRQALGLMENLVAESPANAHYRRELYESYNHMTGLLRDAGRNEEADALASKALPINEQLVLEFPGSPDYRLDLGKRYRGLARQKMKESQPSEAEAMYRRALAIHEKLVADFPDQSRYMTELANCRQQLIGFLRATGDAQDRIEKLHRQDIAHHENWTTNSPNIQVFWQQLARSHNTLGIFLRNEGRKQESEVECRKAQELWRQHPDPALDRAKQAFEEDPQKGTRQHDLAVSFFNSGEWQESLAVFEKGHGSAWQQFFMAMDHWQLDNEAEARKWFYNSISWMDDVQEIKLRERQAEAAALLDLPDPWDRSAKAATSFKQGNAYEQQGKPEKARTAYDQGIGLYESLLADFPTVPAYRRKLVDLLTKTGRQPEVEALHRKDLDLRREPPVDNRELAAALAELTRTLLAQQKFTEAEPLARECLALRKKIDSNGWKTFNARSLLGGSLLGQKKFPEAEPLLLSGYEGLNEQEDKIPTDSKRCVKESLQRLVQLYMATNQSEKAAKWQKKLTESDQAEAAKKAAAKKP